MMAMTVTRQMHLSALLAGAAEVPPGLDRGVDGLCLDSRRVRPGDCFIALDGAREHGARYARDAEHAGAVAVLVDRETLTVDVQIPVVVVPDLRRLAGVIANRFYGTPSAELKTIGITGTNGKTTVAHICAEALDLLDHPCGYVGTLGTGRLGSLRAALNTTPDAIEMHAALARFRDNGCACAALEISSHALAQHRVSGVRLEVAVFTNLGHDHLDYHGDLAAYAGAKKFLFHSPGLGHAVVNTDDAVGRTIVEELDPAVTCWAFGVAPLDASARAVRRVAAQRIESDSAGTVVEFVSPYGSGVLHSRLLGRFNGYNLLAGLAVLLALEIPLAAACRALEQVHPITGRMERFGGTAGLPTVVVDYAHTPDSLACALEALRALRPASLHCVFGCGGERDQTKRPIMGSIAARLADRVVVTSDNPRGESAGAICRQILDGIDDGSNVVIIEDREAAIRRAVADAGAADIVLVAGKGHESVQQIGREQRPFQDQSVVRAALRERRS